MRLVILGGSGRLGSRVVREALARDHRVTVIARAPEALALDHPNLERVALDIRDRTGLFAAVRGHDAAIATLGPRRGQEAPSPLNEGMANLVAAMEAEGLARLIALASAGILQLDATRLRCERPGYPEAFRQGAAAHRKNWELLAASSLDWTLVCPPELVEGDRDDPVAARVDHLPEGPLNVSMEALARWMVDALDSPEWSRKRVGVLGGPDRAR